MASRFIIILVTALLVCSCGKSDKPEYVDDKEVKQETQNRDSLPPGEVKNIDSNNVKQDEGKQQTEKDKFSYQRSETPVAVISPLEASDYMGKYVTVKGIVVDIYKSDKVAYLNFVEKYPNNPFTGVIFANKFEEFGDITKYEGRHVEVNGRVSTFRGKPQMILDKLSQIKIVN